MTIKGKAAIAGGALALLVGTFAAGRWSAPKATVSDRIVTTERDTSLEWHAYVGHSSSSSKASSETHWRTHTVWLPSGAVEQTKEKVDARKSEEYSQTDMSETDHHETAAVRQLEQTHEVKPAKGPDWVLAARAGVDLHLSPIYGASVSRRVLGPVFVELWGQRPWAGGLGLGLAF